MSRSRIGRPLGLAWRAVGVLLALSVTALWPVALGGWTSYVTTHGISMEPRFHGGDLAILRSADDYKVGDLAAYRSDQLKTVVMHRIVAVHDGRYTFKGDNNDWLDPETPVRGQLLGKLTMRVPQGGVWLQRLSAPTVGVVTMLALLAGSGTAIHGRRRRRRREMSRHAARTSTKGALWGALSPALRASAAVAAGAAVLGLGLAAFAWSGHTTRWATAAGSAGGQLAFSYSAPVPPSAAYDTTLVRSPDPVFRKLAQSVDVQLAYRGAPGSVAVEAELSTPGGWRSTVPLAPRKTFTTQRYDGSVRLDLPSLEARARAASAVTGLASSPLTISLVARIETRGGTFSPSVALTASSSTLGLAGDTASLVVKDASSLATRHLVPRTLSFRGLAVAVTTARPVSAVLLGASALALLVLAVVARLTAPVNEAAAIRRRWSDLLVEVQPVPTPQGRPLVDVTSFETLVKLAERYGLLVLHWNRSDVDTFVVQDEGTTFRYRTTAAAEQRELVRS